jgi:hypothetical protein
MFAVIMLMVLFTSDVFQAKNNNSAWGGNSATIIRQWNLVKSGNYAPFTGSCLEEVFEGVQKSSEFGYKKKRYLNYVVGSGWQIDLLSRWSNSLEGRIDDLVLELTIPMGSNGIQPEIVENFKSKYPGVVVMPIKLSKSRACSY